MNNQLTPAPDNLPEGGTEADLLAAQIKLWEFLGRRVARYTMGDSTSVPTEVAQELLASVCLTLGLDMNSPQALKSLLNWDLDARFAAGLTDIERKIKASKRLWKAACLSVPKIENISLHDTLKSIGSFPKRYDYRFFAHQIPCDIDYQLCRPVPDSLLGVDYVNQYLRRILIENDLMGRFDAGLCIRLLDSYCPDYRGLLINLYEPVATNAIGLALCGGDVRALDISDRQRGRLAATLKPLPRGTAVRRLQSAASAACDSLGIRQPQARLYLRRLAADLWPRIDAGSPEGIFLPLR